MRKHTIFMMLALTMVWIILMEGFSWQNAAIGMFMSMLSLHYMSRFFPFDEIRDVSFFRLAFYPFWLIGRIYSDAFFLIKLILTDAKWGVTTIELELESETLRVILCDSITLTPGSVYLDRDDKKITLLCIGSRHQEGYPASFECLRSIERMLLKSQINVTPKTQSEAV